MRIKLIGIGLAATAIILIMTACGPTATFPPTLTEQPQSIPPTEAPTTTIATATTAMATATIAPAASPTPEADISQLKLAASPQIRVLDMQDNSSGWALSGTGVLRTADGGTSWHDATPAGVSSRPETGAFLGQAEAWVLISGADLTTGTLYHTVDGGIHWTAATVPFGAASIQFTDPQHGWALASLGFALSHEAVAVYRTSEGGATWNQVFTDDPTAPNTSDTLPFAGDKSGLTALDDQRAWVSGSEPVSDYNYLFATTDGGKTWTEQNPALPADLAGAMTSVFPPIFLSPTDAVLPVNAYANTTTTLLYVSHDEGKTWAPTTPAPIAGKVSLPNAQDFFIWDGGPTIYTSHDAGKTWPPVTTNVNFTDNLVSFQFADVFTGWAVTSDANSHYQLYQTMDGGLTWNVIVP